MRDRSPAARHNEGTGPSEHDNDAKQTNNTQDFAASRNNADRARAGCGVQVGRPVRVDALRNPAATASEKAAPAAPAEAPAISDGATDTEEREAIRQELEQREATRAEQRRLSCEKARSEIQRVGELPARRVQRIDENGQQVRMTEDDQKAHLEKMRTIEAENCQ